MEIQIDNPDWPFITFADPQGSVRVLRALERHAVRFFPGVFFSQDGSGAIHGMGGRWKRRHVREGFAELAATFDEGLY